MIIWLVFGKNSKVLFEHALSISYKSNLKKWCFISNTGYLLLLFTRSHYRSQVFFKYFYYYYNPQVRRQHAYHIQNTQWYTLGIYYNFTFLCGAYLLLCGCCCCCRRRHLYRFKKQLWFWDRTLLRFLLLFVSFSWDSCPLLNKQVWACCESFLSSSSFFLQRILFFETSLSLNFFYFDYFEKKLNNFYYEKFLFLCHPFLYSVSSFFLPIFFLQCF